MTVNAIVVDPRRRIAPSPNHLAILAETVHANLCMTTGATMPTAVYPRTHGSHRAGATASAMRSVRTGATMSGAGATTGATMKDAVTDKLNMTTDSLRMTTGAMLKLVAADSFSMTTDSLNMTTGGAQAREQEKQEEDVATGSHSMKTDRLSMMTGATTKDAALVGGWIAELADDKSLTRMAEDSAWRTAAVLRKGAFPKAATLAMPGMLWWHGVAVHLSPSRMVMQGLGLHPLVSPLNE